MTIYAYDTEFLELGPDHPIELISIGIAAEDGREYYAVNADADWKSIRKHRRTWGQVARHLPRKPLRQIAAEVRQVLLAASDPQLWAQFGDDDHVAIAHLYEHMADLPEELPTWSHDLDREVERRGRPPLPKRVGGRHVLADARHVLACLRHLGITKEATR